MKKRFLSVLLASAMVASCLTGCGGGSDSSGGDTSSSGGDTAASSDNDTDETSGGDTANVSQASDDAVQNLIDATTDTVSLRVWASEEDQEFTQGLIDSFEAQYPDVTFDIQLGAESESSAKDTILADVEAAADVFAFADDQINELVKAGALQEISAAYTYDVASENSSGSVEAATVNGKLYAYPMTADNGYFLFYNSDVYSESDVESMDKMAEVAAANGSKVGMIAADAWYGYSFFKAAGYDVTLQDDGSNACDWNSDGATDVAQALIDLGQTDGFECVADTATLQTGISEGIYTAVVSGTWDAELCEETWGDGYAAAKLPTYTVAGNQLQMSSFSGYKLIGVNPYSSNVGWSMLLAEYLTNEDSQIERFEARGLGPANIKASESDTVQASPAIAALAAQAEYAVPQRVGGNYWSPVATLLMTLFNGNPDGTDLQTLLDNAVEGITAPIE
jgi:arabinogalactan oligomer/maltooligosaccharide transport system substrate-binding protein